jgi:hypothetical protein
MVESVKTTMETEEDQDCLGHPVLSVQTVSAHLALPKLEKITNPCYQFQRWAKALEVKPHLYHHPIMPTTLLDSLYTDQVISHRNNNNNSILRDISLINIKRFQET